MKLNVLRNLFMHNKRMEENEKESERKKNNKRQTQKLYRPKIKRKIKQRMENGKNRYDIRMLKVPFFITKQHRPKIYVCSLVYSDRYEAY